jgi:multicomponent Na+:H+ antiporter subunit G
MIGEVLMLVGAGFVLLSGLGVVRFRDTLARMHAGAKSSTLGVLLILGGAALNLRGVNDITSILLAAVLHTLTSPPAANMVSRAAYLAGAMPTGDDIIDEGASLRD